MYIIESTRKAFCGIGWVSVTGILLALAACTPQGEPTGGLGPITTGTLSVGIDGLPAGVLASVTVTNAQGFQQSLTATQTLNHLTPGSYTVAAAEVTANGDRYSPAPASQSVAVIASTTPTISAVAYVLVSGRLQITVSGVPTPAIPAITVTGPSGYSHTTVASETLTGLEAGSYHVAAASFVVAGDRYDASPAFQDVGVTPGSPIPTQAAIPYAIATGRLIVTVAGLPGSASSAVQVTGPGGFSQAVVHTDTLVGLTPGAYSVAATPVTIGGAGYSPTPANASVSVLAGSGPTLAAVTYSLGTGGLQLNVTGLPAGADAAISVTGPEGWVASLTRTTTLTGLLPGSYTISAANVAWSGQTYVPSPVLQTILILADPIAAQGVVDYAIGQGSLAVTVAGLPGGVSASVTVTGPGGFSQGLTASQTLSGLTPGSYTIVASTISSGGFTYVGAPPSQLKTVAAGATVAASVTYAASTGQLQVTIAGLPGGTSASVTVTGPGAFSQLLTASQTLTGLAPGTYTVAAAGVVSGPTTYTPVPVSQSPSVSAGSTATASVSYSGSGGGATLNLTVNGVYLTQATQKYDGSVPLVAGRTAYLRVFALANQANSSAAQVRVRLYNDASLVQTYTIPAPAAGVPTAVDESSLTGSWNVLVPGTLVQPNLRVLADVDPSSAIAESDDADNQFPLSGTPGAVDVRALPTYTVRFVPVLQQVNGLVGNVSSLNQESFLNDLKKLLPVGAYDADVRAPYTTTAAVLQSDNANGAWGAILSELLTLRFTEGSTRYYYGVVKTTYGSGVAGIGYVGGSSRTALGWDNLPSGSGVMAHEVGHNMSRQHAPCGGVASPDPAYPYAGGKIGVWGFDPATLSLKSPLTYVDLMGYCSPAWVSDYNWSAMVTYRQSGPNNAPTADPGAGPGLLVWGRMTPTGVVLEPAFTVTAAPSLAPAPGPHRLDLQAADGSILRSISFDAAEVADLPGGSERHFAFVVPLDQQLGASLGRLTVRSATGSGTRQTASVTATGADPAAILTRTNAQQVDIRWNVSRYPMVMVRDVATGQVISLARGGSARLWTRGSNFDLQFSDGVKSVARRQSPQ